jgi:addiction module HigA family antidote
MAGLEALSERLVAPRARALPASPRHRQPPHPGLFLETRYLKPLAISQQTLARELGISRRRVNEFIRGRRGITADTAVRLARFFGNDERFWMELQAAWDVHAAARRLDAETSPHAVRD